ncbi:MAG: glycoside hydrolase family 28 protein [Acidobacteria bacterium]|nr:glycoside hydrolase family 28 protein [Acidobacteriota bacterium]
MRLKTPLLTRREFLQSASAGCAVLAAPFLSRRVFAGWDSVADILSHIRLPVFPKRDFDIMAYGAASGGSQDCTDALRRAIAACSEAGGGRVVVPAGDFLTGAVHLRSNINLYISDGATLRFSPDPSHYLPAVYTRWEGVECLNYSPFLYAFEQENIAITGSGTLDGQADKEHWWPWTGSPFFGGSREKPNQMKARVRLFGMGEDDIPVSERVFGEGSCLRPSFVQFYRCRNVLIAGVTVRNSPMWQIHPVLCSSVTVRGVKANSHGPNNDGCNPESCRDVLIEDCMFDTGDDCIAIKSGRNRDGRRIGVPSENIIVRNCRMKDGHGGVTIGSEASGGVRNVFAENCSMDSPNLDRALRLKTNSVRGGFIENIFMRNVTVGQVADAVLRIDLFYEEGDAGQFPPVVRNIEMHHVTSQKSKYALYLRGYKRAPLRNIRLSHCSFSNVAYADVIDNVEGLVFE